MRNPHQGRRYASHLAKAVSLLIVLILVTFGNYLRVHFFSPPLSDGTSVHFIDVGQGDSTLFLSEGEAVLVDAGTPEAGGAITQYLEDLGVHHLRAVISTHPHADHIGGLSMVLAMCEVDQVLVPEVTSTTRTYENMLDMLESKNVPVLVPDVGDVLTLDSGASFRFVSPPKGAEFENMNNYSLVCVFEAEETKILMMGDAEIEIEQALLESGADVSCDIIKLGHHGSSTSSSVPFLKLTEAKTAIISCGRENSYGHPHQKTLDSLAEVGIDDIRSTAAQGTIVIPISKSAVGDLSQDQIASEENAA